jgi:hypothetical protein
MDCRPFVLPGRDNQVNVMQPTYSAQTGSATPEARAVHTMEGSITRAGKARSPFIYLPFPVPADASRLTVRYEYSGYMPADEHDDGNTLDLGLFGPGGIAFGAGDFRGWSGSFRSEIAITPTSATPSYLPGLPPGEWNVFLGAYNIGPAGCRYRVEVSIDTEPSASLPAEFDEPPAVTARTAPAGPAWYKGDLHCHTFHSDGGSSLRQLTGAAKEQGLHFLAITDHNTISHHAHLGAYATADFLPLPAEEITTYFGHANVWGISRWVEFRCTTTPEIARAAELAHQQGALFSINHPKEDGPNWKFGLDFPFDCMEIWQAPFWVSNYQSLALWDLLLRQGRRIVGVGGSDLHRVGTEEAPSPYPIGAPTTWVYAQALTMPGILDGLRQGHVAVTAGPGGPTIQFAATCGGRQAIMGDELAAAPEEPVTFAVDVQGAKGLVLRLISARGVLDSFAIPSESFNHELQATPEGLGHGDYPLPYLRAEVIQPPEADLEEEPGALMVEALTNPIYIVH